MTDCALRGSSSGMCEEGATGRACVCERGGGGRRRPCLRVARCAATPTRTRALPPPREAISVKRPIHAPPWPLLMQTTRRRAACSRRPASRSCSGRLRRTRCSPRARSRSSTCARPGSLRASGCRVRPMCRRASPALRGCSSTFGRCARPARSHEPRRPARRAHARALIRASVRAWQGFVEELRASHPPEAAPLLLMCELGVVSLARRRPAAAAGGSPHPPAAAPPPPHPKKTHAVGEPSRIIPHSSMTAFAPARWRLRRSRRTSCSTTATRR